MPVQKLAPAWAGSFNGRGSGGGGGNAPNFSFGTDTSYQDSKSQRALNAAQEEYYRGNTAAARAEAEVMAERQKAQYLQRQTAISLGLPEDASPAQIRNAEFIRRTSERGFEYLQKYRETMHGLRGGDTAVKRGILEGRKQMSELWPDNKVPSATSQPAKNMYDEGKKPTSDMRTLLSKDGAAFHAQARAMGSAGPIDTSEDNYPYPIHGVTPGALKRVAPQLFGEQGQTPDVNQMNQYLDTMYGPNPFPDMGPVAAATYATLVNSFVEKEAISRAIDRNASNSVAQMFKVLFDVAREVNQAPASDIPPSTMLGAAAQAQTTAKPSGAKNAK